MHPRFTFVSLFMLLVGNFAVAETPRLAPPLEQQAKIKTIDSEAEVLHALEKAEFEKDGSWQHSHYYSIRISSLEAARDYGRIVIPYDHYYSDISLDFANARSKSGKITPVSADAVQRRITGGGQDFYSDNSELVFSLPNVVPGSIIEFQYTQVSKKLAFPEMFTDSTTPWYFQRKVGGDGWRGDTVRNYQYTLTSPADTTLHFKYFQGFPEKVKTEKNNGKIIRRWSWKDVEAFHSEAWMPPFHEVGAMMELSTHTDWSAVDAWTWEKVVDKLQPTPELKAIVRSFDLQKNASREEKIRAVYAYLQNNIRYVFAHLGRGGYEPHFPEDVVKANYGDCKDQTVLAIALLRMLNIQALPALVETPHAGKSDTELVSLMFDHMIVYIPADEFGPAMYMDTTGDRSLFPGVSNYLEGQNTLVVNGKGGIMMPLHTDFAPSYAHLYIDYGLNDNNRATANVRIELSGFFEQNTRSWWINSNERENNLITFIKGLYSSSLEYDVNVKLLHAEDIWRPVQMQADFVFTEPDDEQHTRAASFNQVNYLFGSAGNLPLPESRKHPFYDDTEYHLYMTVNFQNIVGLQHVLHTKGEKIVTPWYTLNQEGKKTADAYQVNISYEKPKLILNTKTYANYYEAFNRLASSESWLLAYTNSLDAENLNRLQALKSEHGESGFEYLLALAESNIDNGDFEDALEPARKAVELNNTSGKAWYVLALAHGFNSNINESKKAFEKARSLGYMPW